SIKAERFQIHISGTGTAMLEHDPSAPWDGNPGGSTPRILTSAATITEQIEPGEAVSEPQSSNHRFFFWIDENDTTPDIQFEMRNEDGTAPVVGGTVDWYLLYRFRAGSWDNSNGAKFD